MVSEETTADKQSPEFDDEDVELGASMSFLEHLVELRERLIYALISLVIGCIIALIFSKQIITILQVYIPADVKMISTNPIEVFVTYLKLSLVGGIFISFPFLFYQAWMFIGPGLYKRERRAVLPIVFASWACFILGGLFCYFVVFRFALEFFAQMGEGIAENNWKISEYLNFMLRFLLAFGIVFEEPVVIFLLARLGIVTRASLSKFRPYAIVIMFTMSAIITPPDPLSQLMCAGPLLILYELSLILVRFIEKKREEEKEEEVLDSE
jgi:sec-independent protein translocase protein TatC